jgi:hypothetical protein
MVEGCWCLRCYQARVRDSMERLRRGAAEGDATLAAEYRWVMAQNARASRPWWRRLFARVTDGRGGRLRDDG